MKAVTADEMRAIDRITIEERGFPGPVLMGLAGKSVADFILDLSLPLKRAILFAGTGNNGGDGFVAAYFLFNAGIAVDIYCAGSLEKLSDTSRIYYSLCDGAGISIIEIHEQDLELIAPSRYDCVIDALTGTGFIGPVRGIMGAVIRAINNAGVPVVSIDMPSGLESDGRAPSGDVVKADYTVTIGLPKISLVTMPGRVYAGELFISDIGFPRDLTDSADLTVECADDDFVKKYHLDTAEKEYLLSPDTHKGKKGHLLLVGGFDGMEGAIMMAARAALEYGVGLITLLTTGTSRRIIAGSIPELMALDIDRFSSSGADKALNTETLRSFLSERKIRAIVIGPGLGRGPLSEIVFNALIAAAAESGTIRVLIDGDALFHLTGLLSRGGLPGGIDCVLTPHFGEASRLLKEPVSVIKDDRLGSARRLARETGAVALLKGPASIITDGIISCINTTGNPSLATAGSGDTLAGIIGAALLRDISPLHAAALGALIHGRAADILCGGGAGLPLKATDVIRSIRNARCEIFGDCMI